MSYMLKQVIFEDGSCEWIPATPVPYFQKASLLERIFGVVSRKKLIAQVLRLYLNEDMGRGRGDTPEMRVRDLYYQEGNCNALNALCSRLGIDINTYIKDARSNGQASL